jgi:proteasome accessory factor C
VDTAAELGEGRLAATLRVGDPRWLVRLALRLAPAVTVVEPVRLRDEVQRTARATLSLYADSDPTVHFGDAATPGRGDGVR